MPGSKGELEAATEGMAQQAHAIDALVVDGELEALDGVVEAPPLRQGEDGGDHHPHPVGQQAGQRQVGLGLHGEAVQQDERRPLAEGDAPQRSGLRGGRRHAPHDGKGTNTGNSPTLFHANRCDANGVWPIQKRTVNHSHGGQS